MDIDRIGLEVAGNVVSPQSSWSALTISAEPVKLVISLSISSK